MLNRKALTAMVHGLARWAKVDDVAMSWIVEHGMWFDNGVMTVDFAGRSARLRLDHAHQIEGRQVLTNTLEVELQTERPTADPDGAATATV